MAETSTEAGFIFLKGIRHIAHTRVPRQVDKTPQALRRVREGLGRLLAQLIFRKGE